MKKEIKRHKRYYFNTLVVTIIVLLILAGVTIATFKPGILTTSGDGSSVANAFVLSVD